MSAPAHRTMPLLPLPLLAVAGTLLAAIAALTLTSPTAPLPDTARSASPSEQPAVTPSTPAPSGSSGAGDGSVVIDTKPGGKDPGRPRGDKNAAREGSAP